MAVNVRKVQQKRIPTSVEYRYKIVNYGADNLYPQTVEEISYRSPTVEAALDALKLFSYGEGFENNGDLVINRYGQTLNDLLQLVVNDFGPFDGWGLHFNVNTLGLITEILPLEFKGCRFGLPDDNGRHYDIKYSNNWESSNMPKIETYPIWQMREANQELGELTNENIEAFEGFAYYWTPAPNKYPRCSFDSVLDSAQTNGEIQVFELGSIQNSFLGTSLFKHPGKFGSEKEKARVVGELAELTGPENAGATFVMEVPQNFEGSIIENIPANNNDTLFTTTNSNVDQRIISRFGVPFPLLGIQPSGGIFNQEQLKDSYIYYNSRTAPRRNLLVAEFNKFLTYWVGGKVEVGAILERNFEVKDENETTPDNGNDNNN